jgi:hypothetical protein
MKNMMTLTSSAAASVINPSSDGAKMADESSSFAAQTSKGF